MSSTGEHRGSPLNDHYSLQATGHISQPPSGLSLGAGLDSRLMPSIQDSSRVFSELQEDVRSAFPDVPTNHVRGRRPSRMNVGKRQPRSRRSSSALSDQEQNLEVHIARKILMT